MPRQYRTAASHFFNLAAPSMRAVLFLDYDGCLHPMSVSHTGNKPVLYGESSKLFERAPDLVALLAPYPDVDIVLITDWVERYGAEATIRYLPQPLQERVVGTTDEFGDNSLKWLGLSKFDRIMRYVTGRRINDWLALQHDDGGWPEAFMTQLVWSHPELGLAEKKTLVDLKDKLYLLNARNQRWRR